MNFIQHLLDAFAKMDREKLLKAYHVSLYISLFRIWNRNRFDNPIWVNRDELKTMSKIGSNNTYYKALRTLEDCGFIKYTPSFDPQVASKVYLYTFDIGTCTPPISKVNPLYKHIKYIYSIYSNEENQKEMKETNMNDKSKKAFQKPPIEHIQIYFEQKGYSEIEAQRFFNYYESNGWMVGGRSKMKDWKAAARNWMLNIQRYQVNSFEKQGTNAQDKMASKEQRNFSSRNYNEPL
ncbi:hypothetical protein [Saccharicrinis fermentans]|nr:hypothetical protein [Saccharicrinis fermentans]